MAIEKTPRLGLTKYSSGSDLHPNRTEFNALQDLLESLVAISAQGTLSARPPAGVKNRTYWATDTARQYFDDGKQWLDVNPNGGGGAGQSVVVAGTAAEGTSARAARADHTHNLPLAAATVNGAMAAVDKKKLDAATAAASAYTLALRNAEGQIMVGTPTSPTHAAHKEYVDGQRDTRAAKVHSHNADDVNAGVLDPARLPSATRTLQGALSAADKTKLDTATSGVTGGTLVMRADNGQFQVPDPTSETHAVNLRHVSAMGAQRVEYKGELGTASINSAIARGVYSQSQGGPVIVANGYPVDGAAGTLVVLPFGPGETTGYVTQEWTQWATSRRWLRSTNDSGQTWRGWVELANTSTATTAADGLMSVADKKKLDAATSAATASALMQRDSAGAARASTIVLGSAPGAADHATRKDYVDGQINTRATKEHTHSYADVERPAMPAGQDLDLLKTSGIWHQGHSASASLELNYPLATAGLLEINTVGGFTYHRYTTYGPSTRVFIRAFYNTGWGTWKELSQTTHVHDGSDITTGTVHPDRIANATATLDGLMPKTDKATLDKATASATGSTLVERNSTGQIAVADPAHATHATTKGYVDDLVATKANASHKHGAADLPPASATAPGLLSAADKAMLDGATYINTPGTLVQRHPTAGTIHVINGSSAGDAVNRGYVDGEVAKKANSSHKHSVGDLNAGNLEMTHLRLTSTTDASETSTGHAFQIGEDDANNIAIDNNEIIGRKAGALELISMPGGLWGLPAPLSGSTATNKEYVDGLVEALQSGKANASHNHSGTNITSGTINPARIANATQSGDGLMSLEDKKKLDIAGNAAYAGRLVLRDDRGSANFKAPVDAENAANKAYVDAQVAPLEAQAVQHFVGTDNLAGTDKPAGVPWKHFSGPVLLSTGAGGASRTATPATDAGGYGSIWFGYNGVPKFTGIMGMQMTTKSADEEYLTTVAVMDINTSRVKYRAWRLGGTVAGGFGNMLIWCDIWGW